MRLPEGDDEATESDGPDDRLSGRSAGQTAGTGGDGVEDPLGEVAATLDVRMVEASDGWRLRVFTWTPTDAIAAARRPLLFVPGWTSVVEGWRTLLAAWVEQRPVHYIETREKNRTAPPEGHRERKVDFGIEQHMADLAAVSERLVDDVGACDWYASSLGSTCLIEGFKSGAIDGRSAFLLAPNARFKFPLWAIPLIHVPWWFYSPVIRLIILPYLRLKLKERGQYIRYRRTLRAAHMRRLKMCTLMARGYEMWEGLEAVSVPCAIAVAESDALHGLGDALRISEMLPLGEVVEVESNQWAHEPSVIPLAEAWQDAI